LQRVLTGSGGEKGDFSAGLCITMYGWVQGMDVLVKVTPDMHTIDISAVGGGERLLKDVLYKSTEGAVEIYDINSKKVQRCIHKYL